MLRVHSSLRSSARSALPLARAYLSSSAEYDVAVIGGGPGGYVAAIKAAQLGLRTVCIEKRGRLGGTCLNVGCIPSKALLHASHLYEHAKHDFKDYGVMVDGIDVDLDTFLAKKDATVEGLTAGIEFLFKKNGVDYVQGHGTITGSTSLSVELNEGGTQELASKNIIIATGSEVTPLPPAPVDNDGGRIVDSTGALSLSSVPDKMVVIGGGYIGLEMGSVWRRLGSEVTVVEFMDRLVPAMDKGIGKKFQAMLKKQGMQFKLSTKVMASEVTDSGVSLTVEPAAGGDSETIDADVVLVSTGRRPYTASLGLESVGIDVDGLGRIEVNEHLQTVVPNIYAIGDVIPGPMLAHKAEEEGVAAAEFIKYGWGHVDYDAIPGVVYTYPEVATVGRTEEELKEAGVPYNVGSFPMSANSRARTVGESVGEVKILAHKDTDRVLGIHIIGSNAGEMIAEGVLGLSYEAAAEDIGRTCHAHPTLSEAFKEAAMAAYDKPIHF